uniref:Chondroadherin-like protein n=1 Tax=Ascaris suum TaxID=6253 RepID=F1KWW6_ASCSU
MEPTIRNRHITLSHIVIVLIVWSARCQAQYFSCPSRCQCYADPVDSVRSMHLICKWEQLNSSNLESITSSDAVRTLTIRCPHSMRNISTPSPRLFNALRNLDRLEIDRCLIESLPSHLFQGMTQLYSLVIRNAGLMQLPRDIFNDLSNLMALDLAGNDLRIEPYAISVLSNLIQLDLSNNSINFLSNTLVSLHRLKVLSLDENRLSNIDLRRVPNGVTDLTLRNNRINTVHSTHDSVSSLRRLDLSGNQLDFISATGTVNVLPNGLWSVDLTNNKISYIQDGAFSNMPKLTIVDLRNNSLNELREAAVSSEMRKHRLRVLLSGNPLNCMCSLRWIVQATTKTSPTIVDLTNVYCSHIFSRNTRLLLTDADTRGELLCKYDASCAEQCTCCFQQSCYCKSICPKGCTCWHSAAPHVTRMGRNIVECEGVRLDYLKEIPESITELRLLNGNWKEWSPKDIGPKRDLLVLNITSCNLHWLNESFLDGFPSLTQLDLSKNQLQSFPDAQLDGVADLQLLFLNDNRLSTFSAFALKRFTAISKLKLGGSTNKYMCDCENPTPLQEWFYDETNINRVLDYEDMYCELKGNGIVKIKQVDPSQNGTLCRRPTVTPIRPTTRSTVTTAASVITQTISTRRYSTRLSSARRRATRRRPFSPTDRPRGIDSFDMSFLFSYIMFFLVLLLFCLLFAIAATIYFRYCHMERADFHKRQKRVGATHTATEQQPLNCVRS